MKTKFLILGGPLWLALLDSRAWATSALTIAQIPSSLMTSVSYGLGVMFLFGFLWGVVKIWSGADKMSKGDADGKMGIVAGIIIAGAAAIMGALFAIFGLSGGAINPQF